MAVLHREYYRETGRGQEKIEVNQDIRRYIEENEGEDYSEVLKQDERWPVFYHLSQMRTSVLNWYEFKKESSLLEIGGEFGALTGLFCNRCAHVTTVEYGLWKAEAIAERYKSRGNLEVYAGIVRDISFQEKFDYIVLIGCLERQCSGSADRVDYTAYLKEIVSLLKPGGRLLLAVDNRYGIRYFCGEPEPYTGKPFAGINQYLQRGKGYLFARQELLDVLSAAGAVNKKVFYPLPDYKLPQMIYTDECLPKQDLAERAMIYHTGRESLVAREELLYKDIIENHAFPFMSNSFLVESVFRQEDELSSVTFAAVTTDRGREHGLFTSYHWAQGEKRVKKGALYPEGVKSVRQVYGNLCRLKDHGIPIVPHDLCDGTLVMPYVQDLTCSDLLRKIAKETRDKELFKHIFQMIYENILKSSTIVNSEDNELLEAKDIKADYGPILRHCYVDMVPFNCFYVEQELRYFDQEFVKENYPALYPMYRAIMYTYAFTPEAEELVPLAEMKRQYGLEILWDMFRKEEDRFVGDNRRYDVYRHFYTWLGSDPGRMIKNAERLMEP